MNGRGATLSCAVDALQAAEMGTGVHRVELAYDPFSVKIGFLMTTTALCAILAGASWTCVVRR